LSDSTVLVSPGVTAGDLNFYYRHGCHLCEEMAAVLLRGWPDVAQAMRWVDIDSSPQLTECYRLRIPVLEKAGEVVCELEADLERLSRCFGNPRLPV
jgi:hypothetical protein